MRMRATALGDASLPRLPMSSSKKYLAEADGFASKGRVKADNGQRRRRSDQTDQVVPELVVGDQFRDCFGAPCGHRQRNRRQGSARVSLACLSANLSHGVLL